MKQQFIQRVTARSVLAVVWFLVGLAAVLRYSAADAWALDCAPVERVTMVSSDACPQQRFTDHG